VQERWLADAIEPVPLIIYICSIPIEIGKLPRAYTIAISLSSHPNGDRRAYRDTYDTHVSLICYIDASLRDMRVYSPIMQERCIYQIQ
jgi:hypothetical protein